MKINSNTIVTTQMKQDILNILSEKEVTLLNVENITVSLLDVKDKYTLVECFIAEKPFPLTFMVQKSISSSNV